MRRLGGVVIHMLLNSDLLNRVVFLTGSPDYLTQFPDLPAKPPFDDDILEFLNDVSKSLMENRDAKIYSDIITFAFWIRKSSVIKLRERFKKADNAYYLGKGVVFHIAPSNVPCNFAYSLIAGLLNGNANIVRVPSKQFPQVDIIVNAFNKVLANYVSMRPYVQLVRYDRDKEINDLFSSLADMRIVWGGDQTIYEMRKSPLPPRSGEITFADRYSLAVIDSDYYLSLSDKNRVANDFYNDTFFSDQNACTSPRIIIWTGNNIEEAKNAFWDCKCHCGKFFTVNSGEVLRGAIISCGCLRTNKSKGEAIIDLFGPKNNPSKKKRTKEEERIYQRYMGFFMLPLFITEIFAILFPVPVMGLVLAGVAAADLVVFAILTKGK